MKRIMNVYESVKMPIRICFFGFMLIAFGFLIQNDSVNIFYTFTNKYLLMFAQGCLMLGKTIINNLPLIFMIYFVCKKANSGVPIALALIGYFAYMVTLMLFSSQALSTYAYASETGINAVIDMSGLTKYPLETGLIGSFIVAYITRYSFIRSRHRTSHSLLGFLNRDSAAIIYNIVFCTLAGMAVAYVFPYLYSYLSILISYISRDLSDPLRMGLYGALDRTLSILGLGNFIRYPFWYTAMGGSYQTLSGQPIVGDVNIWNYTKDILTTYSGAGRFITPYYVINMFICPALLMGILFSMSDRQERNHFMFIFIMASLASFVAGNPLPLELLMLFTTPFLLLIYIGIVAAVFAYMTFAGVYLGSSIGSNLNTITAMPGTFPDFIINLRSTIHFDALLQIFLIGIVAAALTYLLAHVYFRFLAFNLINSGKDQGIVTSTVEAIGGYDNIENVGSGFNRVNFALKNNELIDVGKLQSLGVSRVSETRTGISIDFGSSSCIISRMVRSFLKELGR
ncbi:MAG: hypothetical protein IKE38_05180 [Erysipelotrichaceae bacterium]|nr:hypothetical protein [Erysipelotrichaceae bacterium]